jgi:hypothetical protein
MSESIAPACSRIPPRYPRATGFLPLIPVLVALSLMGAVAVLFLFNPAEHGFYPFCLLYQTTGLLCPGCGGLRAVHQLLHGHLAAAFRFNALFVCSLPLFAWFGTRQLLAKIRGEAAPRLVRPLWLWLGFAILVVFGILRNLPFAHAAWLAP